MASSSYSTSTSTSTASSTRDDKSEYHGWKLRSVHDRTPKRWELDSFRNDLNLPDFDTCTLSELHEAAAEGRHPRPQRDPTPCIAHPDASTTAQQQQERHITDAEMKGKEKDKQTERGREKEKGEEEEKTATSTWLQKVCV